jgi:ATP-dependent DNA helicase RecG
MLNALIEALRAGIATPSPTTLSGEMSVNVSGKVALSIIQALQQAPTLTIPTLAAQINVSSRTIERHIKKLQQQGVLKRVGSAKTGHWQVEI